MHFSDIVALDLPVLGGVERAESHCLQHLDLFRRFTLQVRLVDLGPVGSCGRRIVPRRPSRRRWSGAAVAAAASAAASSSSSSGDPRPRSRSPTPRTVALPFPLPISAATAVAIPFPVAATGASRSGSSGRRYSDGLPLPGTALPALLPFGSLLLASPVRRRGGTSAAAHGSVSVSACVAV